MFFVIQRCTVLIVTSQNPEKRHLFVSLTSPFKRTSDGPEVVLLASLSTLRSHRQDKSCVLKKGEHPFVRVDSFIDYSKCRIVEARLVADGVARGEIEPRPPMPVEPFERIVDGLRKSPHAEPQHVALFDAFTGPIDRP